MLRLCADSSKVTKIVSLLIILMLTGQLLLASPIEAATNTFLPNVANNSSVEDLDCSRVTEIPRRECEALAILYNRTNGPNWYHHAGWLANNRPCTWWGVACENGHVVGLMLGKLESNDCEPNNIIGTLPQEFINLSKLQTFVLCFYNSIPPIIWKLTNLQSLVLRSNGLDGSAHPFPLEVANLTNLRSLDLYNNALSGAIPPELGNLTHLKKLDLTYNQLKYS